MCALLSRKGKLLKDLFKGGQILCPLYCPLLAEELKWDLGDFYIVFCLHDAFFACEVILEDMSHMIVSVADVTDSTCYSSHIPIWPLQDCYSSCPMGLLFDVLSELHSKHKLLSYINCSSPTVHLVHYRYCDWNRTETVNYPAQNVAASAISSLPLLLCFSLFLTFFC